MNMKGSVGTMVYQWAKRRVSGKEACQWEGRRVSGYRGASVGKKAVSISIKACQLAGGRDSGYKAFQLAHVR